MSSNPHRPRHAHRALVATATLAFSTLLAGQAHAAPGDARVALPPPPTVVEGAALEASSWDVAGRILVDADDALSDAEVSDLAGDFGLTFTETELEDETRIEIAKVEPGRIRSLLDRLRKDDRVERAEPLSWVRANFAVDDPLLKDQWHMDRIGAPNAWDFATGHGVTVAVVDTGVACENHGPFMKGTDLAGTTCVEGWNIVKGDSHANDDQGHGTHVAGTIAQSTNNGIGATGVAFDARLMPVKVLNARGWGTTADVADGIRWAADHGAHVINLSLGGPRNSKIMQAAVDHALAQGVVVVAAAGNSGGAVGFPGASEGVIGVSAIGKNDKLAPFSSRGDEVDLAAPGVAVVQQTICESGRNKCEVFPGYSGTSMAAPHVAGAAALLISLGVTDPEAVEGLLKSQARVVDDSAAGRKLYGSGILQAHDAVRWVTMEHALVRLMFLLLITGFVTHSARKKTKGASPWSAGFWVAALATGPGLLFFAPWLLPRAHLLVDVLARPVADLDLYVGASLHRWLPLANVLLPMGLTAIGFGVPRFRRVVAGVAAGTAAYLLSVAVLSEAAGPFGQAALVAWCAVNAVACLWLARMNLSA